VNKTNLGLVKFAKKTLVENWGYVRGTYGKKLTETILQEKIEQCGTHVTKFLDFIRKNYMGRRTVDCVCFIKSYIWWDDVKGEPAYQKYINGILVDVTADSMFNAAKVKGRIATIPDIPGVCVYKTGHIGIYAGHGQVIEAKGTVDGVVQTSLKGIGSSNWTFWFKCPYIEYIKESELIQAVKFISANIPGGLDIAGWTGSNNTWKAEWVDTLIIKIADAWKGEKI